MRQLHGEFYGTEAYIVNDNSARSLLRYVKILDSHIDVKIRDLVDAGKINAYVVYPMIGYQAGPSIINSPELNF